MREVDEKLFQAVKKNKIDEIKKALKNGADINAVNEEGQTPLIYATTGRFARTDVVEALCGCKTNLNAQDNNGMTALMNTAKNGLAQTMCKLLALGADTTIKNNKGYTAYDIAYNEGFYWIIQYMENFEHNKKAQKLIEKSTKLLLEEREKYNQTIAHFEAKNQILTQKNKALQKEIRVLRAQNAMAAKGKSSCINRCKMAHQHSKMNMHRQTKWRTREN